MRCELSSFFIPNTNSFTKSRENSAANWTSLNPVLESREIGIESGNPVKFKIGPGAWNSLPYAAEDITLSQSWTSREKSIARDNLAVSAPCRCGILANVTTEDTSSEPRFIEFFGGYMWGILSGDIYRSSNEGVTWTLYCNSWPGTGDDAFISRIIPTSDGEVIVLSNAQIRKSINWATGNSATWSTPKVVPNTTCVFLGFSLDGDGTKFILAEYSTTWPNSRYAHISTDSGTTWTQRYDTLSLHGSTANTNSHLHGVCYDPIGDRFYLGEGHGTAGGVYVSTNNGVAWTRLDRDAFAMGGGDFNAPTVMTATDTGIVLGSDNANNGLYGIVRKPVAAEEVPFLTLPIRTGRDGLVMFAQRGWKDPETGEVYMTFRSDFTDVRPCIAVGTPTNGAIIYEWPTLPVVSGDRFYFAARVSKERLAAYAEFNAVPTTVLGDLSQNTDENIAVSDRGNTTGGRSFPTSVSVGPKSSANAVESVAVGVGASANFADTIAIGHNATVTATGATAFGSGSSCGNASVAIGSSAVALNGCVAVGDSAVVVSALATAVGYAARSTINGVALGYNANAEDFGDSIAIGVNTRTTSAKQVQFGDRHIEITEQTAPSAPATNGARLFARDNGSGKTQLCVRFATGAIQVLATEP